MQQEITQALVSALRRHLQMRFSYCRDADVWREMWHQSEEALARYEAEKQQHKGEV